MRGMTQDDAHIFCTAEQMAAELHSILEFVLGLLRDFGLEDFYLELSTKPESKSVGTTRNGTGRPKRFVQAASDGSRLRYGRGWRGLLRPKISVRPATRSAAPGRSRRSSWTFRPRGVRPGIRGRRQRTRHPPVMIHRALFGSIERFFAILLEHYAGAMPTWLSPVQVAVLPVATAHEEYAQTVASRCRERGVAGRIGRR